MTVILEARHITKQFQHNSTIVTGVNNVSLEVKEGEFVVIMGASGSGKSTLMYSLSGLDQVDEGDICIENQSLLNMSENQLTNFRREKIGFIFQQPTFLKNLNLLDNIILPAYEQSKKEKKSLIHKAKELMSDMGIDGLEERLISQVSGGQLQRAGICRALMNNPKIVFGDEPTGALNSKASHEILELLKIINQQGTTIVLVTHDIKVATSANRVLFMKDGEVVGDQVFHQENSDKRVEQVAQWLADYGI